MWYIRIMKCCHAQSLSSVWLCDLMGCSLPDSSVHGLLQAKIVEWVAISFSRESSRPRDGTHVSCVSCISRQIYICVYIYIYIYIFYHRAIWAALIMEYYSAFKRKEILTAWLKLEDNSLSAISQKQKNKYSMIPFVQSRVVKLLGTEECWLSRAGGGGMVS